jgi:hypothetical protein
MSSSPPTEAPVAADFVCECDVAGRSACEELPCYKEHEGKKYCVLHYPGKEKSAPFKDALKRKLESEDFDFGGVWFPDRVNFQLVFNKPVDFDYATFNARVNFYNATFNAKASFNHTKFNAEVIFQAAKFNARADFFSAKFNPESNPNARAIFCSAVFGAVAYFTDAEFGAETDFKDATFKAVVDFSSAEFKAKAHFHSVRFNSRVNFSSATFDAEAGFNNATLTSTANFFSATFNSAAFFRSATFNAAADFSLATFNAEANFAGATFKDYVKFEGKKKCVVFGEKSSLNLQFIRIEKPDHFSFHTLVLRPHWFVNVDARKFEFIRVNWDWRSVSTKQEIKSINEEDGLSSHQLLAIACRKLAVNAEENHLYEEASKFRYMAMDARRLEHRRGFAFWTLGWWYWLASGYGERMGRAFLVLLGILVLFAALYMGLGFPNWETKAATEKVTVEAQRKEPVTWSQVSSALLYSAGVMTLQKPEPRPATNAAQALVMLETILGPVQAALLALAIRRKFMR